MHFVKERMKSLSKVALVTGAGTGIGKNTALRLLEEDYSVVLALSLIHI